MDDGSVIFEHIDFINGVKRCVGDFFQGGLEFLGVGVDLLFFALGDLFSSLGTFATESVGGFGLKFFQFFGVDRHFVF